MRIIERLRNIGSTAVYILVGLLLTAGLIGLVFFIKQRGDIARNERATIAYEQQQEQQKNTNEEKIISSDYNSFPVKVINDDEKNDEVFVAGGDYSELPQTGPADVVFWAIGVFAATYLLVNILPYKRLNKLV